MIVRQLQHMMGYVLLQEQMLSLICNSCVTAGGATYAVSDTANVTATVAACHDTSAGWQLRSSKAGGAWC